jgi:TPR repeat protein
MRCFDTELDPRVDKDACRRLGIRSLAIAPFHSDSKAIGFIEVFSDRPGAFDPGQLAKLDAMARRAAEILLDKNASENDLIPPALAGASAGEPQVADDLEPAPDKYISAMGPSAETHNPLPTFGQMAVKQSRGLARTVAWLALVLVGSLAALSVPKLVHRRAEQREKAVVQQTVLAASPATDTIEPGGNVSIRPSSAVEVEKPASTSLQELGQQARAGDSQAQFVLATDYANGEGAAKDLVKAAVWYIVSGHAGNQAAKEAAVQITRQLRPFEIAQVRFNVGKMFADGIGVDKDPVSAYLWFALAEAAGDVRAKAAEGKLAESMTVAEINDAQTRASTWLSGHKRQTTAALHQSK